MDVTLWLSRRVKNGEPHHPHHFIQKEQLADWFEKDIDVFTDRSTFFSSLGRILPKLCPSSSSVRKRGKVLGYSGIELLVNECHVSSGENAVSGVTGITNVDAAGDGNINDKENVVVDLEEHSGFDTVKGRFDVNLKRKFDVVAKEKLGNDVEGSCGILIKVNIDVNVEGNVYE